MLTVLLEGREVEKDLERQEWAGRSHGPALTWGESNPRPKQLLPNVYACILPLISQEVCQQAGLSSSTRSVIRTATPERRASQQVLLSYAAAA